MTGEKHTFESLHTVFESITIFCIYILQVTQVLNMMVRMNSEVEANIVSVERVKEYSDPKVTYAEVSYSVIFKGLGNVNDRI